MKFPLHIFLLCTVVASFVQQVVRLHCSNLILACQTFSMSCPLHPDATFLHTTAHKNIANIHIYQSHLSHNNNNNNNNNKQQNFTELHEAAVQSLLCAYPLWAAPVLTWALEAPERVALGRRLAVIVSLERAAETLAGLGRNPNFDSSSSSAAEAGESHRDVVTSRNSAGGVYLLSSSMTTACHSSGWREWIILVTYNHPDTVFVLIVS